MLYQVQAIGNLTNDLVRKEISGKVFGTCSIAINRKQNSSGVETTVYIDLLIPDNFSGVFPYLTKGKKVFVQGTPRLRAYTSRDGVLKASMSILCRQVELLGGAEAGKIIQQNEAIEQASLREEAAINAAIEANVNPYNKPEYAAVKAAYEPIPDETRKRLAEQEKGQQKPQESETPDDVVPF